MKKTVIVIILCQILWGCYPYKTILKEIKGKFVGRFDNKGTNIQDLIDIDGYYQYYYRSKVSSGYGEHLIEKDSIPLNILFFKDGTFVFSFFLKKDYLI